MNEVILVIALAPLGAMFLTVFVLMCLGLVEVRLVGLASRTTATAAASTTGTAAAAATTTVGTASSQLLTVIRMEDFTVEGLQKLWSHFRLGPNRHLLKEALMRGVSQHIRDHNVELLIKHGMQHGV